MNALERLFGSYQGQNSISKVVQSVDMSHTLSALSYVPQNNICKLIKLRNNFIVSKACSGICPYPRAVVSGELPSYTSVQNLNRPYENEAKRTGSGGGRGGASACREPNIQADQSENTLSLYPIRDVKRVGSRRSMPVSHYRAVSCYDVPNSNLGPCQQYQHSRNVNSVVFLII